MHTVWQNGPSRLIWQALHPHRFLTSFPICKTKWVTLSQSAKWSSWSVIPAFSFSGQPKTLKKSEWDVLNYYSILEYIDVSWITSSKSHRANGIAQAPFDAIKNVLRPICNATAPSCFLPSSGLIPATLPVRETQKPRLKNRRWPLF